MPIDLINLALLSLPRNESNPQRSKKHNVKAGLPINSLPGWEQVPLYQKLPMLKCPNNQVIFSKAKIGISLKTKQPEFDTSASKIPEYNPLHDPFLKDFYTNEKILKLLRKNGEITANNDVISTLKDFNEYRLWLHKAQMHSIKQDLNKQDVEQRERLMIAHAVEVTKHKHDRYNSILSKIQQRKHLLEDERRARFERLLQKSEEKMRTIAAKKALQQLEIAEKKHISLMKKHKHLNEASNLARARLTAMKQIVDEKNERHAKAMRKLLAARKKQKNEQQERAWEERLNERVAHQKMVKEVLQAVYERKQQNLKCIRAVYEGLWEEQDEIRERIYRLRRLKPRSLKKRKKKKTSAPTKEIDTAPPCESIDNLLDEELCDILTATVEMQGGDRDPRISFDLNDPIYKAAKYIMLHIISKFTKDMSTNCTAFKDVQSRIDQFFTEAKQIVIYLATQVIASARNSCTEEECGGGRSKKSVDFNFIPYTIGTSTYQIHPNMELRPVGDRTPTPPGSLASFTIPTKKEDDKKPTLPRDEMLFIEHYLIKFKRELTVGVGRRVFAAIRCHFENKIMDVRKELLKIDRTCLTKQVAKGILSHAVNPLNFETALLFCTNVISSEIIWSLQKNLLRPSRDPRGIVYPEVCCKCGNQNHTKDRLCAFCHY